MLRYIYSFVLSAGLVSACGEARDAETTASPPTGAGVEPPDTDGGVANESSGAADEGGGPLLDVPAGESGSANPEGTQGCDKVDFLFVIDNSGSMADEQENLIASFPRFIETIQTTLDDAQDYHIMVLDVDAWVYETCEQGCNPPAQCIDKNGGCNILDLACINVCTAQLACLTEPGFQCGMLDEDACHGVLGAGVTHPRGTDSSNRDCAFSTGQRYMDTTEANLTGAFECAARVGTSSMSSTELPMEAMVAAVTPGTRAFACNEGFVRDDAILVVTFITDEDDAQGDSTGTPNGWKQALVAAKNGDESAVVVLGLFGDNDQPDSVCESLEDGAISGAEPSARLRQFVEGFGEQGFTGSVCASDYDSFFEQAVSIIDTTCEEFIPPTG